MHRLKKLCLRECSSLLINFAGKQKKNTPLYCYTWYWFYFMCYHKYCLNTPMSDWLSLGSCSGELFIQAHVGSKKTLKSLVELVTHYFVVMIVYLSTASLNWLFCCFRATVKSANTAWINTTQMLWFQLFRLLRHANRNFSEIIQIF